jgi:hypothetical protein
MNDAAAGSSQAAPVDLPEAELPAGVSVGRLVDRAAGGSISSELLRNSVMGPNPFGVTFFGPLAAVALAIAGLILLGLIRTDGGATAVATSAPVAVLALVPVPVLQLLLVLRDRRSWPAQEAYLWLDLATAHQREGPADAKSEHSEAQPVERQLRSAAQAALTAAARGDDPIAPLAAARAVLGRPPLRYYVPVLTDRYRAVGAALLAGVWVLVAIFVAMAASGGVVWL